MSFDQRNQQVDTQINVAGDMNVHVVRQLDAREKRNRQRMLQKVHDFWIKGVLENSLHGAALIALGMEYKPDAVQHPWDMVIQQPDQPTRTIPRGTKIIDVFDEVGGELLILGEPGSGKTTMLLELARDLITRGEQDDNYPIPVVFNLSSWAEKRKSLVEWLVDELNTKYDVPRKIGKTWVGADQVLLLLDGLDEVKQTQREGCVEVINQFRQEYGLVNIVVCSRIADYEILTTKLRLLGAVLVQPLTPAQTDAYLIQAGKKLEGVREALRYDATLRELSETPLMLSVIALAYHDLSAESLPIIDSLEERQRHLWNTYVDRMFHRRGQDMHYIRAEILQWLVWLAKQMSQHTQSIFLLERIQPSWLKTDFQRRWYAGLSLGGGAVFAGPSIIAISAPGLFQRSSIIFGLIQWVVGVLCVVAIGFLVRMVKDVETVDLIRWSWRRDMTKSLLKWLGIILVISCLALIVSGRKDPIPILFLASLLMFFPLIVIISSGISIKSLGVISVPNQRIHNSAVNAGIIGLATGLVTLIILGPPAYLFGSITNDIILSRIMPSILGLLALAGLRFGGFTCIQHFILRIILWSNHDTPLNYVRFLDYCTERIFLRKVGGGYIFVHRLLMEHFASLYTEQESNAPTPR